MTALFLDTERLVREYMQKKPEIIFNWQDPYTDTQGILVINSLKNGACGGGTRVSNTLNEREMTKLAKAMELKFSLYGPDIGGAKSGIHMQPDHPQKYDILQRWFTAICPLLKECYGTAADLNTDFATISQLLLKLNIPHPQSGIIYALKNQFPNTQRSIERMQHLNQRIAISNAVQAPVSELITGFTIVAAIKQFYQTQATDMTQKRAFVQGAGSVGSAAALYLAQAGIKVVAMSDKDYGVFDPSGLSIETLSKIVSTRSLKGNVEKLLTHDAFNKQLMQEKIAIFVPAAGSHLVTGDMMRQFIANDLEILVSGANLPFHSDQLYCDIVQYVDQRVALIPDFVASGGMARAFYAVMSSQRDDFSYHDIFADTSRKVSQLICEAMAVNNGKYLAAALYRKALHAADVACDVAR